ncbi:ATP-binding cassette domain-containing protein [Lacticaseibacillus brantae]|uniref:ABC transporter, ATP-binding protein n=1 Tax=Lacticaseibacillus brantae DSM 23927 TaxID=1423727 RepID=A0A0R2AXW4_9LACO|nr:ABC transporter ATP-binding protein [Lacticaseibacillus brantae]KRM71879.1 ABC transporter, ATP-binding protein [Lacticaseibacillus brantae DSM 23927]
MSFIEMHNVSKVIKGHQLLQDVSLSIEEHQIIALEGINGSGKTLMLKAMLGLIKTDGQITVAGGSVQPKLKYPIRAGILIENPSVINDLTAQQNLALLAALQSGIDTMMITDLLVSFDLGQVGNQKVKKFSLGMKQKLGIAQALLGSNPLIVLDEPTNALDEASIDRLVSLIQSVQDGGSTFVIASHDRDFVEKIADRRFNVKAGVVSEAI